MHGNFHSPHRQPLPEALKVKSKAKAYTHDLVLLSLRAKKALKDEEEMMRRMKNEDAFCHLLRDNF